MTKGEKENVTPKKNRQNDFLFYLLILLIWFFEGYSQ
jgi:hypothetical protein